jgi:UDP-glucose 4-epimerase
MKLSILLTGGLGYVGGRLASELAAAGHQVHCGTRSYSKTAPEWLPQMQMIYLDWDSDVSLVQACQGIDCVIHLAAMNEIESAKNPLAALQMNGLASLRLIEAAKSTRVRRFIYFSTAHVYGSPLQGLITETVLPRPIHPYAITHKVTEDFVLAAHAQKQLEGIVIRLSNSFGAPVTPKVDRWTLLVNDLCRQAATNGELCLNSPGTQLRDFITLRDVSRAVSHLMELKVDQLGDGLFNLGSGKATSIFEMTECVAERWRALVGRDISIHRPVGDGKPPPPLNYCCDKLGATGFKLTSQIDSEIDATLRLCISAFGQ